MTGRYEEAFSKSINDPEGFWGEAAEAIHWYKKWDKVRDDSNKPFYRWFTGGIVNTCYNALDRHVEGGRAEQTALGGAAATEGRAPIVDGVGLGGGRRRVR